MTPPDRRLSRTVLLGILGLFALATLFVFHRQWLHGERLVGNFDRLSGGSLPLRLFEARHIHAEGAVPNWSDNFFMGANVGGLGGMHLGWSPLSWLYAQAGPAHFLPLAAAVAAGFWFCAALGAFLALQRLALRPVAAGVGALCYACSSLITVRLAQGDSLMYNFTLFPWLYWLVAGAAGRRPGWRLAAIGTLMFILFNYSLLQETAYMWAALAAFALVESRLRKNWRPALFLILATGCAVIATAPRIIEVQRDLRQLQRTPSGRADEVVTFERSYAQQHFTSREALRFFSDGIFGRFPSEAAALGNNINLNEGYQVYAATFASLLVLVALLGVILPRAGAAGSPYLLWHQAFAAGLVVAISALVLTKTGHFLLYHLFLKIDFSHGRLVAASLFPFALLVASGLEGFTPESFISDGRRRLAIGLLAVAVAVATLWGLDRVREKSYRLPRLELNSSAPRQLRAALAATPAQFEAPQGGVAGRTQPTVIALKWDALPDTETEIEMRRDGGPYEVMGRTAAGRYTIGDIDPVAKYDFKLRFWRDKTASGYSPEFTAALFRPRLNDESLTGETTWMLSREVVYVGAAAGIFSLWLAAMFGLRRHPAAREGLVLFMAALITIEAVSAFTFRLSGPHTRSFPNPFLKDNLFTAPPDTLNPPTTGARRVLQERLERDCYRTVLLEPGNQFYSVSLHVPVSWDLRTPQGAWSGVPKRLAALPWPEGVVSMRRLIFRPDTDLPWELLGKLNVKYALTVDTNLYFNRWPAGPTTADLAGLQIVENPQPVLPREFFTARTVPAPAFQPAPASESAMPANPRAESAVEGLAAPRTWPVAGRIDTRYAGDRISVTVDSAPAARFLVLNELYHPAWQAATADGQALKIYPVNTVMRGMEIPAGTTEVRLTFRPPPGAASWIAALAFGAAGLLLSSWWASWSACSQRPIPGALRHLLERLPVARIAKWALIGVLFMGFNLPMLYLLVDHWHVRLPLATLLAAMIGTLLRFLVNDRFVFQQPLPTWARLKNYYVANALSFFIWYGVANLLPYFGVHYLVAAISATLCSVGFSLTTNFLWVWGKPEEPPRAASIRRGTAGLYPSRAWLLVLGVYTIVYAGLLLHTDGYPYVLDNNESYSSWWHARSLYENGLAQTKGLTDEVFSPSPAASPNIHSHQGNLPRLFTFLLYAAGCRSIGLHIWITTFTVGLAGIYFAFRFLAGLANPRFAAVACLVMMTNYLLFAQWQVSLYNVWHVFFFFSSLLCVRALGCAEHRGRWALLALLNFAAFFYWEYVFTAFVVVMCALYAVVLYWRRPRTVLRVWLLVGAGAVLAAALLLAQLTAYMGWANVMEDVRLTLTARNVAADAALLERVTSFYREHRIIFWHNFLDAAPLRTPAAFWQSLRDHHLQYYSSPLVLAMCLIGLGWLAGLWHQRGGLAHHRPKIPLVAGLKWLGLTLLLGWLARGFSPPASGQPLHSPFLWLGAAALALVLGRLWLGGWWAWARLGPTRFIPLAAFTLLAVWLTGPQVGLPDLASQESLAEAAGWPDWPKSSRWIVPGAMLVGLTLAGVGSGQVLGAARSARLTRLPLLFLCGLLAYAATYRLFTGYVYSGYLHRLVPMVVFLTDLLLALVFYATLRPLARFTWTTRSVPHRTVPWLGLALPLLLLALLVTQWFRVQAAYATVVPADSYAFLSRLEKEPFKGRSLVSNTYPAPMAARTGSWGYADTSIFSGRVTLTPQGFAVERDLKYLWFADRDTNPAYLKPDLAVTVIQKPNLAVAMQLRHEKKTAAPGTLPLAESPGLVQRAHPLRQAFLKHRLAYSTGDHVSIVRLDWDYPPFLRPDLPRFLPSVDALTLAEKLSLSESALDLRRRWRVTLTPRSAAHEAPVTISLDEASVDGRPLFTAAALAAAGWQPGPVTAPGAMAWHTGQTPPRPLTTVVTGGLLHLNFQRGPRAGKIYVEVNDVADELDLHAPAPTGQAFTFSSANPHGRHTYVPTFAPGLCVQTTLRPQPAGSLAEVRYHFAHQDGAPEDSSVVRLYHENSEGRWQLADTIAFLGFRGVPVRLPEFERLNPDTVAEHARIARGGDGRTFLQWLADHLSANPAEWSRAGIVQEGLPRPVATEDTIVTRHIPLPDAGAGRWQLSVAPATRTKRGPEYFGLPFTLPVERVTVVDFQPPQVPSDAPLAFGRLKMRLRFPKNRWPQSEPLVTTGDREAGDFVYVHYVDTDHIRIGFDHWFKGGPLSPPIKIDFTQEHLLEISLGSLFPAREDVVFAHVSAAGLTSVKDRLLVHLDGQLVIDTAAGSYETGPDTVTVGRNTIFGTLCGPEFTGEIISIERVWPDIK